jgi:hypothetical protein
MHIFDLTRILRRGWRHEAGHGESVFVSVGINSPGVSAGVEAPMTRRECRPLLEPFPSVVTVADNSDRSIHQTCLAHALGNPFGVRWILEWQTIHMIFK